MFTEQQIQKIAPKESAFKAGKKLSSPTGWETLEKNERAIWGSIKGSGKKPYLVQIDIANIAYKCTCPSRQFPCKHAIALLLVLSKDPASFKASEEPDYVTEWLNKRAERAQKVDREEKEITEEEKEKRTTAKVKRRDDRLQLMFAGIAELKLWLKDLIRIGLLELPNRSPSYFDLMMERMVDSKAPGLAGWIRSLKNLRYHNHNEWHDPALGIISKLFLLINAAEKMNQYSSAEQNAIKGLLGWTFNQKDLLADENTITKKDLWLVLGVNSETLDELTIHRYWLQGIEGGMDAIIIQFETKFTSTTIQTPIIEGSILEAELAFYPGLLPHRAFIKKQKEVHRRLPKLPRQCQNWSIYKKENLKSLKQDPWINNKSGIIEKVKILSDKDSLIALDEDKHYRMISKELDDDKASTLLINSNNEYVSMAFVNKEDGILPLGLFSNQQYAAL